MPKYTLLDMVQSVMSDLNEDLVNSIDDTGTTALTILGLRIR
jgi:hypothetical protein